MTFSELPEFASKVSCLQAIDSADIDLEQNLFKHYPAMKLGRQRSVEFYALALADKALALLRQSDIKQWVLTAPPYHQIPAAANLLSWRVYHNLQKKLPQEYRLSLVNLRLPKKSLKINNAEDFQNYYNYSKNTIDQRIKERQRLNKNGDDIVRHRTDFTGRGVIVLNDIKVTGTQQMFMQQSFNQVQPKALHWLYVFEVAMELGRAQPDIEHKVNTSQYGAVADFAELITEDDMIYTARCISRLFSYSVDEFVALIQGLSLEQRLHILDLASREGRFDGEIFAEKMTHLATLSQNPKKERSL